MLDEWLLRSWEHSEVFTQLSWNCKHDEDAGKQYVHRLTPTISREPARRLEAWQRLSSLPWSGSGLVKPGRKIELYCIPHFDDLGSARLWIVVRKHMTAGLRQENLLDMRSSTTTTSSDYGQRHLKPSAEWGSNGVAIQELHWADQDQLQTAAYWPAVYCLFHDWRTRHEWFGLRALTGWEWTNGYDDRLWGGVRQPKKKWGTVTQQPSQGLMKRFQCSSKDCPRRFILLHEKYDDTTRADFWPFGWLWRWSCSRRERNERLTSNSTLTSLQQEDDAAGRTMANLPSTDDRHNLKFNSHRYPSNSRARCMSSYRQSWPPDLTLDWKY